MNTKIKLSVFGILVLIGLFTGANITSAQYVVPTCNSAVLNGYVNPNGSTTTVWFQWGTTASFGYTTPQQVFNIPTNFSAEITGLTQNTRYYFRTVAQNVYGTSYGVTISFTTTMCTPIPTVNLTTNCQLNR